MSNGRGFIFACTNRSEKECLSNLIFATNRAYGYKVFAAKKNDYLFLYNLDSDTLYGCFKIKEGFYEKNSKLFDGRYPYQAKVYPIGKIQSIRKASKFLRNLNINWRYILTPYGTKLLLELLNGKKFEFEKKPEKDEVMDFRFRPPIFATNFWDFPYQSYGDTPKGNNKYPGVTPAFIIFNLLYRYTEPDDLVLDPMAGSGTTIDVCKEERRRVIAFDLEPTRQDIVKADARHLPLKDESVNFVFLDSPYGDNIKYNDHPANIGHISASDKKFYDELEKVMQELFRVLKWESYIAWLIGDQWVKGNFTPVGFKIWNRLAKYFKPVDIVVVARRNQASNTPFWINKALQYNFYLRGFKYLLIFKKTAFKAFKNAKSQKIKWSYYER